MAAELRMRVCFLLNDRDEEVGRDPSLPTFVRPTVSLEETEYPASTGEYPQDNPPLIAPSGKAFPLLLRLCGVERGIRYIAQGVVLANTTTTKNTCTTTIAKIIERKKEENTSLWLIPPQRAE